MKKLVVCATVALMVGALGCGSDSKQQPQPDAAPPQPDAAPPQPDAAPPPPAALWERSSVVQTSACLLDLDCNDGEHCALGICVKECTNDTDCASGQSCSQRGRCGDGTDESQPPPPTSPIGQLTLNRSGIALTPGATDLPSLQLSVTGLSPSQPFRYRVTDPEDLVQFDGKHRFGRVLADGSGAVTVTIELFLNQTKLKQTNGRTTLQLFSDAGDRYVPIRVFGNEVTGRYTAALQLQKPAALAALPLSFSVWPDPQQRPGVALVHLDPAQNLLLTRPFTVEATWDAVQSKLTFALHSVIKHDTWEDADPQVFRQAVGGGLPRTDNDLTGSTMSPALTKANPTAWKLYREPLGNPLGRYVGRVIQVSLTASADETFTGEYVEQLTGISANPVTIRGKLTATRSANQDEQLEEVALSCSADADCPTNHCDTNSATCTAPQLPAQPLQASELPAYTSAPVELTLSECDASTQWSQPPSCANVKSPTTTVAELVTCATDALDQGAPLTSADSSVKLFDPDKSDTFETSYMTCVGSSATYPALVPPALDQSPCYKPRYVSCALAALQTAAPNATLWDEQVKLYGALLRLQGLASELYGFLSNEYVAQGVSALVSATTGLTAEQAAMSYAANAAQLSVGVLFTPSFLHGLAKAPVDIAGSTAMDQLMTGAMRTRWEALSRFLERTHDALQLAARIEPASAQDEAQHRKRAQLIRSAALAAYIQGALLANETTTRFGAQDLRWGIEVSQFAADLGLIAQDFDNHRRRLNPLGLPNDHVPFWSTERKQDEKDFTNYTMFFNAADKATANTSELASRWSEVKTAYADMQLTKDQRKQAFEKHIADLKQQVEELCGSGSMKEHPALASGTYVKPTEQELQARRAYLHDFPTTCVKNESGRLYGTMLEVANAYLDFDIAGERMKQIRDLVAIESQRVERITDVKDKYLKFRYEDMTELRAIDLAAQDRAVQGKQKKGIMGCIFGGVKAIAGLKQKPPKWGDVFSGLGAVVGGAMDATSSADSAKQDIMKKDEIQRRMALRVVEEAKEIEAANSQAAIKSYLVKSAELLLERQRAVNKIRIAESKLGRELRRVVQLVHERERLIERYLADPYGSFTDPTMRMVRRLEAMAYLREWDAATTKTWEAVAALEYETGMVLGLRSKLWRAATPTELRAIVLSLEKTYTCFANTVGQQSTYSIDVSLAEDIFGISTDFIDPVTGGTIDRHEQFRRILLDNSTVASLNDTSGYYALAFSTDLAQNDQSNFTLSALTRCADQIASIQMQFVGPELQAQSVNVFLEQTGTALIRSCESKVGTDPASDKLLAYDLLGSGLNAGTAIQAGVNAWSTPNPQLESRPVANSRWLLTIQAADMSNAKLDLSKVDDVRIKLNTRARGLKPGGHSLASCTNL